MKPVMFCVNEHLKFWNCHPQNVRVRLLNLGHSGCEVLGSAKPLLLRLKSWTWQSQEPACYHINLCGGACCCQVKRAVARNHDVFCKFCMCMLWCLCQKWSEWFQGRSMQSFHDNYNVGPHVISFECKVQHQSITSLMYVILWFSESRKLQEQFQLALRDDQCSLQILNRIIRHDLNQPSNDC